MRIIHAPGRRHREPGVQPSLPGGGGLPWEGRQTQSLVDEAELLASSGAISKLIDDLVRILGKAFEILWSEVRRCRSEEEEGWRARAWTTRPAWPRSAARRRRRHLEDDFLAALERPSMDSEPVGKVVPVGTAAERQAEGAAGSS